MKNLPAPSALHINLQRLLIIRLIVFICQLAALAYAYFVLALALQYGAIIGIFVLLTVLNGWLYLRLLRHSAPGQAEFFIHLLLDIVGLSLLLYLSGGATNPFVSYFLVPITIAAATLKWSYTWLLAALALCCYSLLLFFYQPLAILTPVADSMQMHESGSAHALSLHIIGMWFNFLVSAALITWFVVRMAAEIRQQEERLRHYREDTLRNEQILAVAIQAAGTAHELGTPLGTMAILLKDLTLEHTDKPELLTDLKLMQQQVDTCRGSLRELSQQADFRNRTPSELSLTDFMQQLLDKWQLLRPETACPLRIQAGPAPMLQVAITLQQALINILNNAAEASPKAIALELSWDLKQWCLKVQDYGPGISREIQEQLGTTIFSTKASGMGVGLVLSQATINHLGGKVSLYPLEGKGTLTEIVLPLVLNSGARE